MRYRRALIAGGMYFFTLNLADREIHSRIGSMEISANISFLAHFVRGLVGLDRSAALSAFSELLNDRSLTPAQMTPSPRANLGSRPEGPGSSRPGPP